MTGSITLPLRQLVASNSKTSRKPNSEVFVFTHQIARNGRSLVQRTVKSEHFFANHLNRANDWEIHRVFNLEFCTTGDTCKVDSNTGWKSLDDLPDRA